MTNVVHIKPGNFTLYVDEGESVLDAALRQEFIFPYSCQSAVCGTCGGTILQGQVEYYDPEAVELTEEEEEEGIALFCSAMPKSDLIIQVDGVIAPPNLPTVSLPYHIKYQQDLSSKMLQLMLYPEGNDHIHYRAGQYIYLHNSKGQKQAYSVTNAPSSDCHIELHVRHTQDNEFTNTLLADIAANEVVTIEGPCGLTLFRPKAKRPILMIAGGSGFTQMKSLFEQSINIHNELPIHLFWVVREKDDFYSELPELWQQQYEHFQFTPVLSREHDSWEGASGRIYEVAHQHYPDFSNHQVYASGPGEMVKATLEHMQQHGLHQQFMYADALEE